MSLALLQSLGYNATTFPPDAHHYGDFAEASVWLSVLDSEPELKLLSFEATRGNATTGLRANLKVEMEALYDIGTGPWFKSVTDLADAAKSFVDCWIHGHADYDPSWDSAMAYNFGNLVVKDLAVRDEVTYEITPAPDVTCYETIYVDAQTGGIWSFSPDSRPGCPP